MSSEPNRKIEDLLKRYAAQRKAASSADFEIHPATRNLLQGEVARTFAKEGGKKSVIFKLWPRLAIAGAFTAMLVVAVMILNQPAKQEMELAQTAAKEMAAPASDKIAEQPKEMIVEKAENRALAEREVPATAPAPLTRSTTRESNITDRETAAIGARSESKLSEPNGQVAPTERQIEALSDKEVPAKYFPTDTFARATTAVVHAPAAPPISADAGYAEKNSQNRWHFLQQDLRAKYRKNLLSPAQPKILQSFELTQTGNKIRLIESDGSIYNGEILAVTQDALGKKAQSENSSFSFRVVGTNQQIKRVVSFSGKFNFTKTNERTKTDAEVKFGQEAKPGDSPGGVIQGKVSIGGTNEFEILATQSPK